HPGDAWYQRGGWKSSRLPAGGNPRPATRYDVLQLRELRHSVDVTGLPRHRSPPPDLHRTRTEYRHVYNRSAPCVVSTRDGLVSRAPGASPALLLDSRC